MHEHPAAVVSVACTAAKCGRARNGDDGLCVPMHIEAAFPPPPFKLPSTRANARVGVLLRPVGVQSTSAGGKFGHPPACTDKRKKCACICTQIHAKKSRAWRARAMRHAQGGAGGAYGGSEWRRPLPVHTSTFAVRGGSAGSSAVGPPNRPSHLKPLGLKRDVLSFLYRNEFQNRRFSLKCCKNVAMLQKIVLDQWSNCKNVAMLQKIVLDQ